MFVGVARALLARLALRAIFDLHRRSGKRQVIQLYGNNVSHRAASQQNSDAQR
ncbi:MAG: hypothetical protein Q8M31_22620 [Beijerinckiaceae bacterium]|nr:hypothetical protein [Beijerinckiaceae bacterium]